MSRDRVCVCFQCSSSLQMYLGLHFLLPQLLTVSQRWADWGSSSLSWAYTQLYTWVWPSRYPGISWSLLKPPNPFPDSPFKFSSQPLLCPPLVSLAQADVMLKQLSLIVFNKYSEDNAFPLSKDKSGQTETSLVSGTFPGSYQAGQIVMIFGDGVLGPLQWLLLFTATVFARLLVSLWNWIKGERIRAS